MGISCLLKVLLIDVNEIKLEIFYENTKFIL